MHSSRLWSPLTLIAITSAAGHAQWKPKPGPLMTRWAADVSPENVHREYPRPQMVRPHWQNLNGLWDYAVRPRDEDLPLKFDGVILVPFPVESALSGVMRRVGPDQRLWYRRMCPMPASWLDRSRRVLLHFGAADWETTVWVNGQQVGTHRGGYDAFTFDITYALHEADAQEIVVAVWDPTDSGQQPRGKQVRKPGGIWYTPTTGIWQTVWLEPVPQPPADAGGAPQAPAYIQSLHIVPDVDKSRVRVSATVKSSPLDMASDEAARDQALEVAVLDGERVVAQGTAPPGAGVELTIPDAKLWSPRDPFLYGLRVALLHNPPRGPRSRLDAVESYFGMRKVAVGKDKDGVTRILLNNRPLFMCGPLDQGFWPDGLYTAPTDAARRYDIEITRQLGFNLARKHVKIEPARWYYWCDRLGLLVWQDMPSGDKYIGPNDPDIQRSAESARQYEMELKRLIDGFRNHPSIVMWVPFNEGWGQYDTARIAAWIKQYDPTRLVNAASGWTDRGVGDVHDIHAYPGPAAPEPETDRAAVLGEFGGLGLPLAGHTWQKEKNWGYRSFESAEELTEAYLNLIRALRPMIGAPGLSAAVYTQTSDVEIEVNGLLTYDRAVVKMDAERVAAANRRLYLPPPTITTIVPTSQEQAIEWRYTFEKPAADWYAPDFDDSTWQRGPAGFGRAGTPGAVVRTEWHTSDIWIRRDFDLAQVPTDPHLSVYHDEDCDVYLNGKPAAALKGYTTGYVLAPLAKDIDLRKGRNVLAIHCHQTAGGQGIDAGIVDVVEHAGD